MAKPARRRITMADLAILIAGVAFAMGLLRVSWETNLSSAYRVPGWVQLQGYRVNLVIVPISLGLASALVASRAIRPRPRWRIVFRQPGTSACLAILGHMLFIVITYPWYTLLASYMGTLGFRPHFNTYLFANRGSGAWVAVAWSTLALARVWRPEPSWIDRSGRILGVVALLQWLWSALTW